MTESEHYQNTLKIDLSYLISLEYTYCYRLLNKLT